MSLILAFSLVEIVLPALNRLGNLALTLDYSHDTGTLLAIFTGILVCCGLAGLIPALLMANVRPKHLIGGSYSSGRGYLGRMLRGGLTVVQFAAVGIFFVLILGFAVQLRHMQNSDLGFSRDHLLTTDAMVGSLSLTEQFEKVLSTWRRTPGIMAVA
ncbi:MAG: hypothetical protein JF615_14820, partial [Asticcacaulis sp.]|nr:hypothetical protein [Asticcacaulis sp.]